MLLYNLKINENRLFKFLFIVLLIFILIIFSFSIYNIFFRETNNIKKSDIFTINDAIKSNEIFEITEENYTTILQTVTNNIDSYLGLKIHFIGYVYRLIDFKETEFVLARDMIVSNDYSRKFSSRFFMQL